MSLCPANQVRIAEERAVEEMAPPIELHGKRFPVGIFVDCIPIVAIVLAFFSLLHSLTLPVAGILGGSCRNIGKLVRIGHGFLPTKLLVNW